MNFFPGINLVLLGWFYLGFGLVGSSFFELFYLSVFALVLFCIFFERNLV